MDRLGRRLLCKRLGTASLDDDDSQFCSAAVAGADVRIGWETGSLRICSLLRDAARKKATMYRLDLAPIIAKGLATYLQFI